MAAGSVRPSGWWCPPTSTRPWRRTTGRRWPPWPGGCGWSSSTSRTARGSGASPRSPTCSRRCTAAASTWRATSTPTTGGGPAGRSSADLARYRCWYPQVAGRVLRPGRRSRRPGRALRGASPAPRGRRAWRTVVFNHGVHPDPGYAEHADLLGTFEGPWSAYRKLEVPDWARRGPRRRVPAPRALRARPVAPGRPAPGGVAQRRRGATSPTSRHGPAGRTRGDGWWRAVRALRALVAWVAVCSTVVGGCAVAPASAPSRRRSRAGTRWVPPPGATWQWQLTGPIDIRRRRRRVRHRRRRVERRDGRGAAPGRAQGRLLRRRGRGRGVPARPRRLPGRRPGRLGRLRRGTPARHPPARRPAPDHGRAVRHVPREGLRRGRGGPGRRLRPGLRLPPDRRPTSWPTTGCSPTSPTSAGCRSG